MNEPSIAGKVCPETRSGVLYAVALMLGCTDRAWDAGEGEGGVPENRDWDWDWDWDRLQVDDQSSSPGSPPSLNFEL